MKVCVVRLDALGDTLLSTPAIALLQRAGCEVGVVTHPAGTGVLRGLAETLEVTPQASAGQIAERMTSWGAEVVGVFSEKRRAIAAAFLTRLPVRAGFDPGMSQPLKALWLRLALTHRVPLANRLDLDPGLHEVERYHRLAQVLVPHLPAPPRLHLELREEERLWASTWLGEQGLDRPLALQLTPKWALHGIRPNELRRLNHILGGSLLGFYGPAERVWAEEHFGDAGLKLCYQPQLHRYGALLARCRALVTVDTGAAHIAAAVNTPTVDVFPALHSAHCVRRWRPWQVAHRIVLSQPGQIERLLEDIMESLQQLLTETV